MSRILKEWDVFWVSQCRHTKPVKDKLITIVAVSPSLLGLLINSGIPKFVQDNEKRLKCYAAISKDEHRFLSRHSYVACDRLFEFKEEELNQKRGSLSMAARKRIKNAAQKCPLLTKKQKILINKAYRPPPTAKVKS